VSTPGHVAQKLLSGYIHVYVDGYKLLAQDTCRLYICDIITIHLCRGQLLSLCIQQQTGNKLATKCWLRQVDTTCIRQHVYWCKRGISQGWFRPFVWVSKMLTKITYRLVALSENGLCYEVLVTAKCTLYRILLSDDVNLLHNCESVLFLIFLELSQNEVIAADQYCWLMKSGCWLIVVDSDLLIPEVLMWMLRLFRDVTKGRFPLPELTARVDGCQPSTRPVNSGSGNRP